MSQGELIAGVAGLVLLIDLWFKWYGVNVSAGGALRNFNIGVSANAWESFGLIDIILFLVALIAIGVAVLRALNNLPDMPYPPGTIVMAAGGLALLLIIYRIIDTPVDTGGVEGIDVTRKFGVWLGLIAAAAVTYGGWRASQEEGSPLRRAGTGAGGAAATSSTAATTQMPAEPGVPGGGAAGVSPGKEGPGAPHPGTSTGAPGEEGGGPPPAAADPVPGETAPQTPPGIAGEPPRDSEGTKPPGL